jgi:hypothetical protein
MNRLVSGYMMVFSMLVIALVMIMVTGVVDRARVHTSTMQVLLDREKARLLALSGLEFAQCRLANPPIEQEESQAATSKQKTQAQTAQQQQQDPTQEAKALLGMMMPQLDVWQVFRIESDKQEYGTIKICIGCEEGKLNINHLYDFVRHEFLGQQDRQKGAKLLVEQACRELERATGGRNLFEKLDTFLKDRKFPLNDVTEILSIKEFASACAGTVFLEPVDAKQQERSSQIEKKKLYLTDLFTTWSKDKMIQPWLMSPSLKYALGLKKFGAEQREKLKEILQRFSLNASWSRDWDQLLAPIYGKSLAELSPAVEPLLSTRFEPTMFSVVSYGSVKNVTQKLYAIVERKRSSKTDGPFYETTVKRLYWL